MGKDKVAAGSEKSEMEEDKTEVHKSDKDPVAEDGEKAAETGGEAGAAAAVAEKKGEKKEEKNQSERESGADSTKKVKTKVQKKASPGAATKGKEAETASDAREASKGGPVKKIVKEEPREIGGTVEEEVRKTVKEVSNGDKADQDKSGERDPKEKMEDSPDRPAAMKSPTRQQSAEKEEPRKSETEEVEDDDDDDEVETEMADDGAFDEEEKSEEEERKEAEKDLALTMSSSWAPLSERERESLKVNKSGREERDKEAAEAPREGQSESLKERGRAREDDGETSKEKSRQKKQKLSEPPLLSLSLPDTSLNLASSDPGSQGAKSKSKSIGQAPKPSETERSFSSFGPTQSQSNGCTNSLSLSLSHPFFHNASCSLTQTSFDDKEGTTCSSRQISILKEGLAEGSRGSSLGVHEQFFQVGSEGSNERSKHRRELPLCQKLLQIPPRLHGAPEYGEGTRDSSRSFMDERPTESLGNHVRVTEDSHRCHSQAAHSQGSDQYRWKDEASLACGGMERSRTSHDRSWSIRKDNCDRHRQEDWSSPSRSASFHDRRYDLHKLSGRDRRPDGEAGRELNLSGSRGFVEREDSAGHERASIAEEDSAGARNSRKIERNWLLEIVTEPIPRMAVKLQEVSDSFLESLKKCLQDTLGRSKRKEEFVALQRTLQRRSNLTTETLQMAHRTQLEILVALKTGIPAFLHPDIPLATPALVEIFLGTKCRNVSCLSQLPADDCECKVCSSKGGFCNACMCVVCSKFDFDSNTCRWIGCDFCLHWCHSDCGIQMGHISSGLSTRGTSGDSVMQFRCIGCEHTSELYGFVKDVFTSCAKEWSLETLAKELQCVRRIFHKSEDARGKQLFYKAEQQLVKLNTSRDTEAVCQNMLKVFAAGEKEIPPPRPNSGADGVKDVVPLPREKEMSSRLADVVRDAINVMKAPNGDGSELEKAQAALQSIEHEVEEKRVEASELDQERLWQKMQIDELENIVHIRQAEAKMFQMRAEEVRREAEGLQSIVQAKKERLDEEYNFKMVRLRLPECEERRRKWSEEVQSIEKAQRDYNAMKTSMVSDVRLLEKQTVAQ